ncbi:hypothetical protein [Nocardioides sp. W7]|uniref:hypothetical protein n=1 Tax=Nocardioides sp. W7 TaxID=2931390 RepID=UPI001FD33453|nr:hypothetical protein [Nocardioides sp. W7]
MSVDRVPESQPGVDDPPTPGASGVDGFRLGRALRLAAPGLPRQEAQQVLDRLQQLESNEHRTDSAALSPEERRSLWSLRAALAGRPEPTPEQWAQVLRHWTWLIDHAPEPTGPGTSADLLRTTRANPGDSAPIERAVRAQAETVGVPDADVDAAVGLLTQLIRLDQRPPSLRDSTRAAHALAPTAGLPRELVDLHTDAAAARLAMLTATLSHAHLDDLETGGPDLASAEDQAGAAPRLAGPADAPHIVVAAPELAALNLDILDRADGREIDRLRVGSAPDPHSLFGAAVAHWLHRSAERPTRRDRRDARTSQRLDEARRLLKPSDFPKQSSSTVDDAYAELDRGHRSAMYAMQIANRAEALPLDVYTTVQHGTMSEAHVTAGFNYLRGLLTSRTLSGMSARPATLLTAIRQVTRHMERTAPERWGGHERGRTDRRAHMGAVCLVALQEIDRARLTADREVADLLSDLRPTVDIATVGALASWMRRERLQTSDRNARVPRSDVWHASVQRAVVHLTACGGRIAADPDAGACALDAAATLDQLAGLLDELGPQQPEHDLAPSIDRLGEVSARLRARAVTTP